MQPKGILSGTRSAQMCIASPICVRVRDSMFLVQFAEQLARSLGRYGDDKEEEREAPSRMIPHTEPLVSPVDTFSASVNDFLRPSAPVQRVDTFPDDTGELLRASPPVKRVRFAEEESDNNGRTRHRLSSPPPSPPPQEPQAIEVVSSSSSIVLNMYQGMISARPPPPRRVTPPAQHTQVPLSEVPSAAVQVQPEPKLVPVPLQVQAPRQAQQPLAPRQAQQPLAPLQSQQVVRPHSRQARVLQSRPLQAQSLVLPLQEQQPRNTQPPPAEQRKSPCLPLPHSENVSPNAIDVNIDGILAFIRADRGLHSI